MRVAILGTLLVATSVVSATNFNVAIGSNGLTYNPNTVNASMGDTITFTFAAKNHSVTQSSFAQPCVKLNASAIDSGFKPVSGGATSPTFQITVNSTNPLWFHCAQTGHCQAGMVFAVNPTASQSFAQFQSNAENGGSSTSGSSSGSSTPSSSGTSSGSGPYSTSNAAVIISSNFGGLLSLVGLVAGLSL